MYIHNSEEMKCQITNTNELCVWLSCMTTEALGERRKRGQRKLLDNSTMNSGQFSSSTMNSEQFSSSTMITWACGDNSSTTQIT